MKALNSASDRSPPASVWFVEMNDSAPPVVRASVDPGVVADFLPVPRDLSLKASWVAARGQVGPERSTRQDGDASSNPVRLDRRYAA